MAKHNELKGALEYIRGEYEKGTPPFEFTTSDIVKGVDISEKKAKEIIKKINTHAQFWRGGFQPSGDSFVVTPQVYDRIKNLFV